jgi:organic radical activating enzyme
MTPDEIFEHCHNKHILITGGEPLHQGRILSPLISRLLHSGKKVQIETNGSYPIPHPDWTAIPGYDQLPVYWVVDHKCPSSGMSSAMLPISDLVSQIHRARKHGDDVWIKWVITDERDLEFDLARIGKMTRLVRVPHLISPIDGKGEMVRNLVKSIREYDESLVEKITFSVQLHKIINMP